MLHRKQKKVLLTTVEERSEHDDAVIRLGKEREVEDIAPPVRIGPPKAAPEPPAEDGATPRDFRSHQPDIDDLIDRPAFREDDDEEVSWGNDGRRRLPRPWGWFALAGVFLTIAVLWALHALKESGQVKESIRIQTKEAVFDEAAARSEAEALVSSMEAAIRSYFTASTIESRLRWVRFPERVEPMMRAYEISQPPKPSPVYMVSVLQPLTIANQSNFWMAVVVLESGSAHELIIESTADGPRIDWETLVCHQPMPWDEFVTQRPTDKPMDFRVHAQPNTFYSHEFQDETQWACYRLTAPGSAQAIYGYVRRGSAEETSLASLDTGILPVALILRLQFPPDLKAPMSVMIQSVRSPRWLYLTAPEEDIHQ